MVFSAYNFVFYFLPFVLVIYYGMTWAGRAWGISTQRLSLARNSFLLFASYIFYGWWSPWYVLLMLAITLVNYFCGWWMSRPGTGPRVRFWTATAGIVFSLGTLGFFKYYVFFQTNLNSLLTTLGTTGMDVLQIALPMGISFYTFQALSYTIDVYRGTAPPVEVVNLFERFGQAKQADREKTDREKTGQKLYMAQDTHWSPAGLQLAAQAVAAHVIQRGWAARGDVAYRRRPVSIERIGDLIEMLQVPQIEHLLGPERCVCAQVVESDTETHYHDDPQAEILVLGDSFLRVFEQDEPGAAGFVAQLACELQQPLTSIINDGGGATLVRQELARKPELLEDKRLVIWEFVERDIQDETVEWQDVPLPAIVRRHND